MFGFPERLFYLVCQERDLFLGGSRKRTPDSRKARLLGLRRGDIGAVTGFVTFASREGYAKANHETLRIFGVQLRDSMCRTRPTERCTALFVENPEGVTGEEMEASVNRALDPNFRVSRCSILALDLPVKEFVEN